MRLRCELRRYLILLISYELQRYERLNNELQRYLILSYELQRYEKLSYELQRYEGLSYELQRYEKLSYELQRYEGLSYEIASLEKLIFKRLWSPSKTEQQLLKNNKNCPVDFRFLFLVHKISFKHENIDIL